MALSSCAVKCHLVNDKDCCWSGCIVKLNNQVCVVTTIAPITVLLPCKQLNFAVAKRFDNISSFLLDVSIFVKHSVKSETLTKYSGSPVIVWKSYKLASSLREVKFSSDLLANKNQSNLPNVPTCCSTHEDDDLLSWFILFSLDNWTIFDLPKPRPCKISQGMIIWAHSFPFGDINNTAFHNCASKGIISNIINDVFVVVDACILPGSQGAGIYASNSNLIGIVICPLELKTGQLAGLTVVCSWTEVKKALTEQASAFKTPGTSRLVLNIFEADLVGDFCNSVEVACLSHSQGWGSGVVVAINASHHSSKCYIATCRHVVEPAKSKTIQARLFCGYKYAIKLSAKVVYSSPKGSWLDFALLEVPCDFEVASKLNGQMKNCTFEKDSQRFLKYAKVYKIGSSVFAKGHCLFESGVNAPTVTNGIISNILYAKRHENQNPVMVHSNCTILDGASGGGLFSNIDWCFYGLVVNNVKQLCDNDKHVLFQKINFVLPASIFMPSVMSYVLKNTRFSTFDKLSSDEILQKQWLLEHDQSASFTNSKL